MTILRRIFAFFFYTEAAMSLAQQIQQLKDFEAELDTATAKLKDFDAELDSVAQKWADFQAALEGADIAAQTDLLKKNTDSLSESVRANQ